MKVAQLTKYGKLAASTRQRFDQYGPYLRSAGFTIETHPLLDDFYLERLYSGKSAGLGYLISRYARRLQWLLTTRDVDLLWVHCELFPFLPGFFELSVKKPGVPIVFDYDDAIFHNYDLHKNFLIRKFLGRKLGATISSSRTSFCGNRYLADYAGRFCSSVSIVPTVVDTRTYSATSREYDSGARTIGWIGTSSTWKEYMQPMMPMLAEIAAEASGRIMAVGAGSDASAHPLLDNLPWAESTEVSDIQKMDVGVMPLEDTPWARGKCGYKLIQYMACGLPVVASPVGVNAEIVEHGVNGFLAQTQDEWRAALGALLRDPDLRRRMGSAGRRKIEAEYSLKVWGPRVARLIGEAAGKPV